MAVILPRCTPPRARPAALAAMNLLYAVALEPDARPSGREARSFIRLRCRRAGVRPAASGARLFIQPHCTRRKKKLGRKLTPFPCAADADSQSWKSPLPDKRGTRTPFLTRESRHLPARGSSGLRRHGHPHLPQDRADLMKPRWPQKREYPPPKRRKTGKAPETRLFFGKKEQSPGKAPLRLLHGGAVWIKQHLHITPAYCGPRSKR